MSMTDPIADFLTRIRNGQKAGLDVISIPNSKIKTEMARVLKEEGYIQNFKVNDEGPQGILQIQLKYVHSGEPAICGIERASKSGRRYYSCVKSIPKILEGLGIAILTTSKGIVTDKAAKTLGIGGEIICRVW